MCFYCKGEMKPSRTTHVVTYNNCVIVIKNVPCKECVEFSDEVMQHLETIVNHVKALMQEVSVVDYSKVA